MDREIQQRLKWVRLYEECGDAGFVCRRCGISRPTLRKWWRRYQEDGEEGLQSHSRRPHSSPNTKIDDELENLILDFRRTRNLGARRLQSELLRLHNVSLSLAPIHKVFKKHRVKPVKKFRKNPNSSDTRDLSLVTGFKRIPVKSVLVSINIHQLMIAPAIGSYASTSSAQQQTHSASSTA